MTAQDSSLPNVRVLHQLARSGGTVIAKCLAVMDDAILLSEVHPYGRIMVEMRGEQFRRYLPMVQARQWFDLVSDEEVDACATTPPLSGFAAEIVLIDARSKSRGKNLILRDFNTLDFTSFKYKARPPFHFLTVEALQPHFRPLRFFTVRHPADQWISAAKLFPDDITEILERYLQGLRMFSEQAAATGFVRYEDFTRHPEFELQRICAALALPYDPAWKERWADYKKVTGDSRAQAGESGISTSRKHTIKPDLRRRLEENADYRASLELLGYQT